MSKFTLFISKRIGKETFRFAVEGKNFHEAVMEKQKLSFPDIIPNCGVCGSDELDLGAHVTPGESYEYTYIRCKKCRATLNFGQQKKDKEVYYLRTVDGTDQSGKATKFYDWQPFQQNQQQ